ncbi:hypothetical protein [Thermomonas sp.]|uniref:hypothetical protein n=1 Tax=Thermomonas sp. TaxID=1971895 RepID=UPI0035AEC1B7
MRSLRHVWWRGLLALGLVMAGLGGGLGAASVAGRTADSPAPQLAHAGPACVDALPA